MRAGACLAIMAAALAVALLLEAPTRVPLVSCQSGASFTSGVAAQRQNQAQAHAQRRAASSLMQMFNALPREQQQLVIRQMTSSVASTTPAELPVSDGSSRIRHPRKLPVLTSKQPKTRISSATAGRQSRAVSKTRVAASPPPVPPPPPPPSASKSAAKKGTFAPRTSAPEPASAPARAPRPQVEVEVDSDACTTTTTTTTAPQLRASSKTSPKQTFVQRQFLRPSPAPAAKTVVEEPQAPPPPRPSKTRSVKPPRVFVAPLSAPSSAPKLEPVEEQQIEQRDESLESRAGGQLLADGQTNNKAVSFGSASGSVAGGYNGAPEAEPKLVGQMQLDEEQPDQGQRDTSTWTAASINNKWYFMRPVEDPHAFGLTTVPAGETAIVAQLKRVPVAGVLTDSVVARRSVRSFQGTNRTLAAAAQAASNLKLELVTEADELSDEEASRAANEW